MNQHKLTVGITVSVCIIGISGWIYQLSADCLCYSKLGVITAGNFIFWMLMTGPIQKISQNPTAKSWLANNLLYGFLLVVFNQFIVYLLVSALYIEVFGCNDYNRVGTYMQNNPVLLNFGVYWLIVLVYHGQEILRNFVQREEPSQQFVMFKNGPSYVRIEVADIERIEADNNCVTIYANQRKYVLYERLKDWESRLASFGFVKIHRSYVINPNRIVSYTNKPSGDGLVDMHSGARLKVSRNYKSNLNLDHSLQ